MYTRFCTRRAASFYRSGTVFPTRFAIVVSVVGRVKLSPTFLTFLHFSLLPTTGGIPDWLCLLRFWRAASACCRFFTSLRSVEKLQRTVLDHQHHRLIKRLAFGIEREQPQIGIQFSAVAKASRIVIASGTTVSVDCAAVIPADRIRNVAQDKFYPSTLPTNPRPSLRLENSLPIFPPFQPSIPKSSTAPGMLCEYRNVPLRAPGVCHLQSSTREEILWSPAAW